MNNINNNSQPITQSYFKLMEMISISLIGRPDFSCVVTLLIFCTTSKPEVTCPKQVFFPSSHSVGTTVMNHWLPFVSKNKEYDYGWNYSLGPALAYDRRYGKLCFNDGWNSSSKSPPQIDSPPVPLPVGSPVWIMNDLMTRWNWCPL